MAEEVYRIEIPIETRDRYSEEINRADRKVREFDRSTSRMQRRMNNMNRKRWRFSLTARDMASRIIRRVGSFADRITARSYNFTMRAVDRATRIIGSVRRALFSLPAMVTVGLGVVGAGRLGQSTLGAAMNFEEYGVSMEHWLGGDTKRAEELVDWMGKFSDTTPFSSPELFPALTRAVGVTEGNVDEAQRLLSYAADMAALMPEKTVEDAMEALADAQMGEFARLTEFQMKIGKEEFDEMGWEGFLDQVEERFEGGAAALSDTARGQLMTIRGYIAAAFREAGIGALEQLKPRLDTIRTWIDENQDKWEEWKTTIENAAADAAEWALSKMEGFFSHIRNHYLENEDFQELDFEGKIRFILADINQWWQNDGKPALNSWWEESGGPWFRDIGGAAASLLFEGMQKGIKEGIKAVGQQWSDFFHDPSWSNLGAAAMSTVIAGMIGGAMLRPFVKGAKGVGKMGSWLFGTGAAGGAAKTAGRAGRGVSAPALGQAGQGASRAVPWLSLGFGALDFLTATDNEGRGGAIGGTAGAIGGGVLGAAFGPIGSMIGAVIGQTAGREVGKWFGRIDYGPAIESITAFAEEANTKFGEIRDKADEKLGELGPLFRRWFGNASEEGEAGLSPLPNGVQSILSLIPGNSAAALMPLGGKLAEMFTNAREEGITAFEPIYGSVWDILTSIPVIGPFVLEPLGGILSGLFRDAKDEGLSALNPLPDNVSEILGHIPGVSLLKLGPLGELFGGWFGDAKNEGESALSPLPDGVTGILNLVRENSIGGLNPLPGIFNTWFGDAKDEGEEGLQPLPDGVAGIISDIPGAIETPFATLVSTFSDWGKSIAESLVTKFKEVLGIASPSRVFMGFGKDIVSGLVSGLGAEDMKTFGVNVLKDFGGGLLNSWNKIKDFFGGMTSNAFDMFFQGGGFDISGMGGGVSGTVTDWLMQAMAVTGTPARWLPGLETIAKHESGGNPSIVNTWDINARRGTPSIGLMQTIGPTFEAYKMPGMNDITNPVHNAAAAIRYIKSRYGDISNVPGIKSMAQGGAYRGYARGGFIQNRQLAEVGEEGSEAIIPLAAHRRRRAMDLYRRTGQRLGLGSLESDAKPLQVVTNAGTTVTIDNINIQIDANDDAVNLSDLPEEIVDEIAEHLGTRLMEYQTNHAG